MLRKSHSVSPYSTFNSLGLTRSGCAAACPHAACLLGMVLPVYGDTALRNEQTHLPPREKDSIGTTWLGRVEKVQTPCGRIYPA